MFELEDVYNFVDKEEFATLDEFLSYAKSGKLQDVYEFIDKEAFPTLDEFTSILKKKDKTTEFTGEEEGDITSVVTDEPTTAEVTQSDTSVTQPEVVVEEEKDEHPLAHLDVPDPLEKYKTEIKEGVEDINVDLIEKDEDAAAKLLNDKYKKYGFTVKGAVPGLDYVEVTARNGETLLVSLQPFWGEKEEAQKLKDFITKNAVDKLAVELDELEEVGVPIGESTEEIDALITQKQELEKDPTLNKEALKEVTTKITELQEDKIKGEIRDFRAEAYALKGLNYEQITQAEADIHRKEEKIKEIRRDPQGSEERNYGDNINPDFRWKPVLTSAQKDRIEDLEDDIELIEEENPAITTGEYSDVKALTDRKLNEMRRVTTEVVVKQNDELKAQASALDYQSQKELGVPLAKLNTRTYTSQEEVDAANSLIRQATALNGKQQILGQVYQNSALYFDAKQNKAIQEEFVGQFEGIVNEFRKGWDRGWGVMDVIKYETGVHTLQEAGQILAEREAFSQSLYNSEALDKFNGARTFSEQLAVFGNDPFEIISGLAGNSLAMMLPIGFHLVPPSVVAGATVGWAGGPVSGLTVPGGALYGLQGGMMLTTVAMEYGNSILDAMREHGLDLTDPEQVMKGLSDPDIMAEGRRIGLTRGITIGAFDLITGKIGGKFVSPFTSKTKAITTTLATGLIMSPSAEAGGEFLAQLFSGQEIKGTEIFAEAVGGPGMSAGHMAVSTYNQVTDKAMTDLADEITELPSIMKYNQSESHIMKWADRMKAMGKIDEKTYNKIKENAQIKGQVDQSLADMGLNPLKWKTKKNVRDVLTTLINKRQDLQKNPDINKAEIKELTESIDDIIRSKEVSAEVQEDADSMAKDLGLERRLNRLKEERVNVEKQEPTTKEEIKVKKERLKEIDTRIKAIETIQLAKAVGIDVERELKRPTPFADLDEKGKEERVSTLTKGVEKVKKALGKLGEGADIRVMESQEAFDKAVKESDQKLRKGEKALVLFKDGKVSKILINAELADEQSAMHEAFHVVLNETFGADTKLFTQFQKDITNTLKKTGNKKLAARLEKFITQYGKGERSEEFLAELGAALTEEGFDINKLTPNQKTTLQQIAEVINKIVQSVTRSDIKVFDETATPEDIMSFMTDIAKGLKKGEDITARVEKAKKEGIKKQVAKKKPTKEEQKKARVKEQAKKRAKGKKKRKSQLKEPPRGKAIQTGVTDIFINNKELQAVGTEQQYSQYLNSIFPNSKLKDVVYKGIAKDRQEKGAANLGQGSYWAIGKDKAQDYARGEGTMVSAIVNLEDPLIVNITKNDNRGKKYAGKVSTREMGINAENPSGRDSIINYEYLTKDDYADYNQYTGHYIGKLNADGTPAMNELKQTPYATELAVSSKEQVHELGNEADIAGFKEFVGDPTKTAKPPVRKSQIIGEKAKLTTQQKQSLEEAKILEKTDLTPKELYLRTGWERGKDGKWRHDLPDGKLTSIAQGVIATAAKKGERVSFFLDEILDAPKLKKAYPDMFKDWTKLKPKEVDETVTVEVTVRPHGAENAWYIPDTQTIEINTKSASRVSTLLLHELQHHIQFIEDFAVGGNMEVILENISDIITPKIQKEIDVLDAEIEQLDNLSTIAEIANERHPDIPPRKLFMADFLNKHYNDVIEDYEMGDASAIEDYYQDTEMVRRNIAKQWRDGGWFDVVGGLYDGKIGDLKEKRGKYGAYELYQRLAGEVEARNVEDRMFLTPEGRKKRMLRETEDRAREEQIALDKTALRKSQLGVSPSQIAAVGEGVSTYMGAPTTINNVKRKSQLKGIEFKDNYPLSFVNPKDKIDIVKLINDIVSKDQEVFFWVADQLGRGNYNDVVVEGQHYLDAGPSYALDPKNRERNIIWATNKSVSKKKKTQLEAYLKAPYIFIISGSPQRSKLFNKSVFDLFTKRVGDYKSFKRGALKTNPITKIKNILNDFDSWEDLRNSPKRKELLNAIMDQRETKATPFKKFMEKKKGFIDVNELRDGFYKENDFEMNDIMLVLKPNGKLQQSKHSTYMNAVGGEVVGVPDKKINAFEILKDQDREKYERIEEEGQREWVTKKTGKKAEPSLKSQSIAPFGMGKKGIQPSPVRKSQLEYRGTHRAPGPDTFDKNSADDMSDVYPEDIYSSKGARLYGSGYKFDSKVIDIIQSLRGNPNKEITIYRAVPKGVEEINAEDWVTLDKGYAIEHSRWIKGGYKILAKKVKAKEIFTEGNSIHEWGYHPAEAKPPVRKSQLEEEGVDVAMGTTTPINKFLTNPDNDVVPTKEGYVIVYHKTPSKEQADNIQKKGLLLSKKKDVGDPMDKMWLTKGRTDYSDKGNLVVLQVPKDKLMTENESAGIYSIIGNVLAEDVLKVYNQIPYTKEGKRTLREDVMRDFFLRSEGGKRVGKKYVEELETKPTVRKSQLEDPTDKIILNTYRNKAKFGKGKTAALKQDPAEAKKLEELIHKTATEALQKTEWYAQLNDIEREEALRELDRKLSKRRTKAPSVSKLFKIKKDKTVEVTAATVRKWMIKDLKKGELIGKKGEKKEQQRVQREMKKIRKELAQQLVNQMREIMQASPGTLTNTEVSNIVSKFNKTDLLNENQREAFIDHLQKTLGKAEARAKKKLIGDIKKLVNSKGKASVTARNKRKAKGLDAAGQLFFEQAKKILDLALKNDIDGMLEVMEGLTDEKAIEKTGLTIDQLVAKEIRGDKLTRNENAFLDKLAAFDMFADIMNMDINEIQQLMDGLKDVRGESIRRLKESRKKRAEKYAKAEEEVTEQIKDTNGVIFDEDGDLKSEDQLKDDWDMIHDDLRKLKWWSALKRWHALFDFEKFNFRNWGRGLLQHLGTLTKLIDKDKNNYLEKNVYNKLNNMDEAALRGRHTEIDKFDDLANEIDGITGGYSQIKKKLSGSTKIITLANGETRVLSKDNMLRVYALSKNELQRDKLYNQGYSGQQLFEIKTILGPEVTEFADKVVDYLSNDYFNTVNDIYKDVNDINLSHIDNYFPTRTESKRTKKAKFGDGDFNEAFNAETAPALKERQDTTGEVQVKEFGFIGELENHIESMERYKAYAVGVKELNSLFSVPALSKLIQALGVERVLKNAINFAINPNAGMNMQLKDSVSTWLFKRFTEVVLSFKAIQIAKQASSFITAYENYQATNKGKIPGLDLMMFAIDTAIVAATLPWQIKKAYNMSATFRDRISKGLKGDVFGLESGSSTFKRIGKGSRWYDRAWRAFKTAGAAPTVIGDILGVMGYMANYNANIRRGMSKQEAMQTFNDYNATQQTRRETEKIPLQQQRSVLSTGFTMFGSTLFLQMNKVQVSLLRIMRHLRKGRVDKAFIGKEARSLAINYSMANVLFVAISNIGLLLGSDEDEEEFLNRLKEPFVGLNILYQIPIFGWGLEESKAIMSGENPWGHPVITPYGEFAKRIGKALYKGKYKKAGQKAVEGILGTNFDPFVGMYNYFQGEGDDMENMYEMLGISKYYRPGKGKGKKGKDDEEVDVDIDDVDIDDVDIDDVDIDDVE